MKVFLFFFIGWMLMIPLLFSQDTKTNLKEFYFYDVYLSGPSVENSIDCDDEFYKKPTLGLSFRIDKNTSIHKTFFVSKPLCELIKGKYSDLYVLLRYEAKKKWSPDSQFRYIHDNAHLKLVFSDKLEAIKNNSLVGIVSDTAMVIDYRTQQLEDK